jgi:phage shock protein A
MGILNRIRTMFQAKILHVVDRAEDPRETLDYAVERRQEMLADVRRALVEVSAAKHQLAAQIKRVEDRLPQCQDQAQRAVAAGRDDLARVALERRQSGARQLEDLRRQFDEVTQEQQKLQLAERRFAAAVEAFRARRDLLSARYTAAEAQYEAHRSLAGVSADLTDLSAAIHRAESKIEGMQARAAAIEQLLSSGALDDLSGDRVEQELRGQSDQQEIEAQLKSLKEEKSS